MTHNPYIGWCQRREQKGRQPEWIEERQGSYQCMRSGGDEDSVNQIRCSKTTAQKRNILVLKKEIYLCSKRHILLRLFRTQYPQRWKVVANLMRPFADGRELGGFRNNYNQFMELVEILWFWETNFLRKQINKVGDDTDIELSLYSIVSGLFAITMIH